MLSGLVWDFSLLYLFSLAAGVGLPASELLQSVATTPVMPAALDVRYVRMEDATGYEAYLVKKSRTAGHWVFVLPNGSYREARLTDRRTIAVKPQNGVAYWPVGVISDDDKAEHIRKIDILVASNATIVQIDAFQKGQSRT